MAHTEAHFPTQGSQAESQVASDGGSERQEVFRVRSYQLEMLEESMKRNIIVVADTGSGKTFIAMLRMQAELERCPPEKVSLYTLEQAVHGIHHVDGQLVWFCVPTVALAFQQHKAISAQLPAFQARVLSGADNVDFWTEQWIWDEILRGTNNRIVVSTHQILLEALGHGFVRMQQLALLIFDEAHSCIGNHPSSMILRRFYHDSTAEERPAILGLTASPVVNSKVGNLDTLEANLNAVSRTPKLHREELLQHVQKPELIKLMYATNILESLGSLALKSLQTVYEDLDIELDPWIIRMRSAPETCNSKALTKALISQKTYCHDQIKSLYDKARAICNELGSSASDYYIRQCVQKFQKGAVDGSFAMEGLESEEKTYLRSLLNEVHIPVRGNLFEEMSGLSPKVSILIDFLREQETEGFSGLIFARTRADVAVLSHVLSVHTPSFAISTFVGASSFSGRKNTIGELVDVKNQKETLDDLRYGKKNLIVTTNALEEGIDVSRCSLVVCFEKPPNLKSFIQRRGRARKSNSKYVIMFESGPQSESASTWTTLEAEMRELYEDDMRRISELQNLEAVEDEDLGERTLSIKATGAKLTLGDAVQHLYHFCATLPAASYTDLNPIFTFEGHSSDCNLESILATVVLPNSVEASVRHACGLSRWRTEKMAKRDAAFEAYKALYKAGLINDNLLPLGHADQVVDEAYAAVEKRPSLVELKDQINPWVFVAQEWHESTEVHASTIRVVDGAKMCVEMMMLLPHKLPRIAEIDLHWDANTTFKASIQNGERLDPMVKSSATETTSLLLKSIYRNRMADRDDFTILFLPPNTKIFGSWAHDHKGGTNATDVCESAVGENAGLIRDLANNGVPYIFRHVRYASARYMLDSGLVNQDPHDVEEKERADGIYSRIPGNDDSIDLDQEGDAEACVLLEVTRLPKKVDFLHLWPSQDARVAKESKTKMLLARNCEMDRLPLKYAYLAMFIPSILHRIQVALVVEHLCDRLLSPLQFNDRSLVTTAISASSANEPTNYQRQEFLGDSYLKFLTSLTLMARHLNYHEGILSHKKDHIVSNSSLASAAIKKGLDRYILTKAFEGNKWRPMYNGLIINSQREGKRDMSSKTLADVVEALVGAAFLDGGLEKALSCLDTFLPHVAWLTPPEACRTLYEVYEKDIPSSTHLTQIEELLEYRVNLKLLLVEAVTHPSYRGPSSCCSYERLEFLGDAVLDNIITTTAFAHDPPIPTHRLHLLRTALVNGHFLGFLCLSLCILQRRTDPVAVTDDPKSISTVEVWYPFYLWQVMRHASPHVVRDQKSCLERFAELKNTIAELLAHGLHYPWTALAQLEPPKFMSDMVESLLGAIYIDSHGSLSTCESFLEHLGLMSYLRRVMATDIALLHPKEELGQLANQDKVKYVLGKEGQEEKQRLSCKIIVGEKEVVSVGGGRGIMEVQTRAADAACRILRREAANVDEGGGATYIQARTGVGEDESSEEEEEQEGGGGDQEAGEREYDSDVYMTADE